MENSGETRWRNAIFAIGLAFAGCMSPVTPWAAPLASPVQGNTSGSAKPDSIGFLRNGETWAAFLNTVTNDSDLEFYENALSVELIQKGDGVMNPDGDSYVDYGANVTRNTGVHWDHQWGIHGQRIFFAASFSSDVPCLTLKDFREIALASGWSNVELDVREPTHGFKAEKANLELSVEAGGGLGLHGGAFSSPADLKTRLEQFYSLTDCASSLTINTKN